MRRSVEMTKLSGQLVAAAQDGQVGAIQLLNYGQGDLAEVISGAWTKYFLTVGVVGAQVGQAAACLSAWATTLGTMLAQMDTVVAWAESAIEAFEAARVAEEAAGVDVDQLIEQVKQEAKTQIQAISGAAMAELAAVPSWAGSVPAAMQMPGMPGPVKVHHPGRGAAAHPVPARRQAPREATQVAAAAAVAQPVPASPQPPRQAIRPTAAAEHRHLVSGRPRRQATPPAALVHPGPVKLSLIPIRVGCPVQHPGLQPPRRAARQVGAMQFPALGGKRRPLLHPRARHPERLVLAPAPTQVGLAQARARLVPARTVVAQAAPLPCRQHPRQSRFRMRQLRLLRLRGPPQCLRLVFIPLCRGLRRRRLQRVLPARLLLLPRRRLRRCLLLR